MTNKTTPSNSSLGSINEDDLVAGIGSKNFKRGATAPQIVDNNNKNDDKPSGNDELKKDNVDEAEKIEKNNTLVSNDNINNLGVENNPDTNDNINEESEKTQIANKNSRKRNVKTKDFSDFFNKKVVIKDRVAAYVSPAHHKLLNKIVALIGAEQGATITSYLSNILNEHFELYSDEKIIGDHTIKDIINSLKE